MKLPNRPGLGAIIEMTEQLLEVAVADIAAGHDRDGNPITQRHYSAVNLARKELREAREAAARGDLTID